MDFKQKRKIIDLTGNKIGRWAVIKEAERKGRVRYWFCICECGTERDVCQSTLRNGESTSCGCLTIDRMTRHGLYKTKEFKVWSGMISRCEKPKNISYPLYGGRGIKVCDRWRRSFSFFINDMGMRPGKGYDLDRINPDGDYEPGNCRWATRSQNLQNRRYKSKSGYTGVYLVRNKYDSRIGFNGKRIRLGSFSSAEEAAKAYDDAAINLYGINAHTNFKRIDGL